MELVGKGRMRTLSYAARGVDEATDVLAFPDRRQATRPARGSSAMSSSIQRRRRRDQGGGASCPPPLWFRPRTDDGEMLELQAKIMESLD